MSSVKSSTNISPKSKITQSPGNSPSMLISKLSSACKISLIFKAVALVFLSAAKKEPTIIPIEKQLEKHLKKIENIPSEKKIHQKKYN